MFLVFSLSTVLCDSHTGQDNEPDRRSESVVNGDAVNPPFEIIVTPGIFRLHGANGPVLIRGNSICRALSTYEQKTETPQCW